jgi:hypothetical protein
MVEYVSQFGVTRVWGVGEGRDSANGAADSGMSGAVKDLIVKLDGAEIGFNKDADNDGVNDTFGRGASYVPAGALIKSVDVFVEEATAAATLTVALVEKDGTQVATGAASATEAGSAATISAYADKAVDKKGYVKVTADSYDGLKAKVVIRYVM